MRADLILMGGNVLTPCGRASAIAILRDRIIKVGMDEEVLNLVGQKTRIIDLKGRTVIPGLIDAHVHLLALGLSLKQLDLRGIKSIEELKGVVRERALSASKGKWILGRGWDQELFAEGRYPNRYDLDEAAPDNPVFLKRICGHICVVNSKALEIASISKETKDPPGGVIDRDEEGEPTGILREEAVNLVYKKIPPPSFEEVKGAIEVAVKEAVSKGLTGVHAICSERFPDELKVLQQLRKEGKLPLRVYLIAPYAFLDKLAELGMSEGFGNSMLKIGGIKIFVDGSLGARTAALEEPYADMPNNKGVLIHSPGELDEMVLKVHEAGFQAAIHAIGDRAIRIALDAIEKAIKRNPRDHRHRIEHASLVSPELIERMKKLGIVVVCQPHFIFSDFWVKERLGKRRIRWVYALKTLKENVVVAGSSDSPVEPIDPLRGIWAAVTRPNLRSEEKLSVKESLEIYTLGSAYASFDEGEKGSIEEGKLADLTILSEDITKVNPDRIKEVKVEMVIVGGKIVYQQNKSI